MQSLIDWILGMPEAIVQPFGYIIIFFATIIESIPPLGLFIPGQNLVLASGFLAKLGLFSIWGLGALAVVGAWIGELISYFLGKKYGYNFLKKYGKYILVTDEVLEKTEKLLQKKLGLSVLLSRFYGWTRGLMPFMAGVTKVPFGKFMFWSFLSSFVWAGVFLAIGYFLGESYEYISGYIGAFMTWGIIIAVLVGILYWYQRSERNIFKKSFLAIVITNIVCILSFSWMAQQIYSQQGDFRGIDALVQSWILKSPFRDSFMMGIHNIFDFALIGIIGLLVIIYLYRKKLMYHLSVFISSLIGGTMLFPLIKLVLQRLRPEGATFLLTDYSFPSGHATTSLLLCLSLWYVFKDQIKTPWMKYVFLFAMIAISLVIGISRVYLGVHWVSDIIGGYLLALFWFTLMIILWKIAFDLYKHPLKIVRKKHKKDLLDVFSA